MQKLDDGVLLYHGSFVEISNIDLSYGRKALDFGKGFYLTSSRQQAIDYIPSSIRKNIRRHKLPDNFDINNGILSIYKFHLNNDLLIHYFDDADINWLHFIAANRDSSLFVDFLKQFYCYDIICGKVADDNTAATLNSYITGDYGTPGNDSADRFVIERLMPDRLADQFCFKTKKAIKSLEFIGSEKYGNIH